MAHLTMKIKLAVGGRREREEGVNFKSNYNGLTVMSSLLLLNRCYHFINSVWEPVYSSL